MRDAETSTSNLLRLVSKVSGTWQIWFKLLSAAQNIKLPFMLTLAGLSP